jgi:hypothetical protein
MMNGHEYMKDGRRSDSGAKLNRFFANRPFEAGSSFEINSFASSLSSVTATEGLEF